MVKYFEEREEFTKDSFPKIVKAVASEIADINSLKFDSVDTRVSKRPGVEKFTQITIHCHDPVSGKKFAFEVDDGLKIEGQWYFTDRPSLVIGVTLEGKPSTIRVK